MAVVQAIPDVAVAAAGRGVRLVGYALMDPRADVPDSNSVVRLRDDLHHHTDVPLLDAAIHAHFVASEGGEAGEREYTQKEAHLLPLTYLRHVMCDK